MEWVVDIGAGRYVPRDDQFVDAVAELAEPGSEALATMRAAVKAAARPDATRRIAELIASMSGAAHERRRSDGGRAARACRYSGAAVHDRPPSAPRLSQLHARRPCVFGPGLNVIHGQNAQGKTNLLEAIATLALTRSPRTTSSGDLLLWNEDAALAEADVVRPPADVTLLDPIPARRRNRTRRPGHVCRRQAATGARDARCLPGRALLAGGSRRWCAEDRMAAGAFSTSSWRRPTSRRSRTCLATGACSSSAIRCCISFEPAPAPAIRCRASRASSPITAHGFGGARAPRRRAGAARRALASRPERPARADRASVRTRACRCACRHGRGRRTGAARDASRGASVEEIARE